MPGYYNKKSRGSSAYAEPIDTALQDAMNYASVPDEVMYGDPTAVQKKGNYYGNLDREKYFDRLESNLREIGDAAGVMKVQKERDQYLSDQNTLETQKAEIGEKKRKVGDDRVKYLGALAKKNLEILNSEGPEAAESYFKNVQDFALTTGLVKPEEASESFNPGEAQVLAELWSKNHEWKEEVAKTRATNSGRGGRVTDLQYTVNAIREKHPEISRADAIYIAQERKAGRDPRAIASSILKRNPYLKGQIDSILETINQYGAEGKKPAASKMKVPKTKVKFLD